MFVLIFAILLKVISAIDDPDFPVSQQCLGCMCEALSSCDTTRTCIEDFGVCGPFRITQDYWADAGKPTINNEPPDSSTAFFNCATDIKCSVLAIQGYMKTFQQDCNGDDKIDCDDFVSIHKLGGFGGCQTGTIKGIFAQKYQQCKAIVGVNH